LQVYAHQLLTFRVLKPRDSSMDIASRLDLLIFLGPNSVLAKGLSWSAGPGSP